MAKPLGTWESTGCHFLAFADEWLTRGTQGVPTGSMSIETTSQYSRTNTNRVEERQGGGAAQESVSSVPV